MKSNQKIGEIVVTPKNPRAGESFKVEVLSSDGKEWNEANLGKIKVNGMFGAKHWFQAEDQKTYLITVVNNTSSPFEARYKEVEIKTLSEEFYKKSFNELNNGEKQEIKKLRQQLPILRMGRFLTNLNKVQFCLAPQPVYEMGRVDKLKENVPILYNVKAKWEIGGVTKNTSERAQIIHYFKPRSDDQDFHTHLVEVKTLRMGKEVIIRRTVNIQNLFAFNKKNGFLIPEIQENNTVSKIKIIKEKKWCETTIRIKNPSNESLTLYGKKVRSFKGIQRSKISKYQRIIKRTLKPFEVKTLTFLTSLDSIESDNWFTFYLFGKSESGLKVRLEVNSKLEAAQTLKKSVAFAKVADIPFVEGGTCDPDNLPADVPENFVCAPTDEINYEEVPGKFLNALKGDIVVIPGGSGMIGSLLRQVSPAQNYSHSGIMTRNFDEITHNTASEEWLINSQLGMTKPLDENALKFSWPGIISQSIDDTVYGEDLVSPEGDTYTLYGFPPNAESPEFQIYYPLVIKPDPLLETTEIRDKLIQIADYVRNLHNQGHYKWYCYTNPTVYEDELPEMPANYWANNTVPGVCSSTIWMAARELGFVLEGELEPVEVSAGVEIEEDTPDGLYLYTEEERRLAAEFLFIHIRNLARNQSNMSGLSRVSTKLAKQMINTFAEDRPDADNINKIYDEVMENIQDAFAVSPDDLFNWDSPLTGGLYGYVTPLLYRDRRFENVTVHRWQEQESDDSTTIQGTVRLSSGSVVSRCHVMLNSTLAAYTNDNGEFTIEDVPFGTYQVVLRPNDDIDGYSGETKETINVSSNSNNFDFTLEERSIINRSVSVEFDVDLFDYDGQRYRGHAQVYINKLLTLSASKETDRREFTKSFTIRKSNGKLKDSNIKLEVILVANLLSTQTGAVRVDLTARLLESQKRSRKDIDDSFTRSFTVADNQTQEITNLELESNEIRDRDRISIDLIISNERAL
jgi:hypothetical protein